MGKVILQNSIKLQLSPTGAGDFFPSILSNGLLKKILKSELRYLHVIGLENLLLKPLDPVFLGIL